MKSRLGYNQAVIAVGHKLARIVFHMVSFGVEYDEEIDHVKNIKQLDNKRSYLLKTLAKIEKELGITYFSQDSYVLMFQLKVKSPQFIAATLVSIKVLTLRYGRISKELTYCKLVKCSHSLGDQISLSCAKRGYSSTMS